jgi:RsiW-degrading membrane proteinase PrsW (M82 family)
MNHFEVLLAAIAPGLLVLTYGVTKTRASWGNEALWTAFFLGGLGAFGALPVELAVLWLVDHASLTSVLKAGVIAGFSAAVPEETIKYLILVYAAERHVDTRRRQDVIILALAVSLGFATVENFLFVATPTDWGLVAALRALTAVPGHGIDGLAMGALLTAARVGLDRQKVWECLALIVPVIMHAGYDFPLFVFKSGAAVTGTGPRLIVLWITVLVTTSIVAIGLCNWILPVAAQADRLSRRDLRESAATSFIIGTGCAFLVIAVALGVLVAVSNGIAFPAIGIGLGIFPLTMGIDLIRTGLRQRPGKRFTQPFA